MPRTILIADDEQGVRDSLQRLLEFESYRVVMAPDGPAALAAVRDRSIDLALIDIKMPGMDGLEVLSQLHADHPQLPVVIISGHGTIQTAVEATRLGAFDFVEKPIDADRLLLVIRNGLAQRRLLKENVTLKAAVRHKTRIVGEHPEIQRIMETIRKVAPANARVLIMGENGTGKEMVARALHELSPRAEEPFVEVNCAAIPEELIESELFGHERGAFTGAVGRRVGKFELADSGTLFLDEVGDMSLNAQAKVLRVLQESVFERVGGTETMRVDVRVIAATNKDLLKASRDGAFREDLFYRLNVVPITVPPLRDRPSDIPLLVEHFLQQSATELGQAPRKVSRAAMEALREYTWPGNVRDLKNFRRADEYARRDALLADDLRVRELVAAGVPTPIDDDARAAIAAEATTALWGDAMSEAVCAVCDELIVLAELHELELRDGEPLVDKMRTRLRAPAELRAVPALLAHYRVLVPGVTDFDDVLLSPRGVAR
jgi:two-component system nitrogen regulation response regulator NtrX